MKGQVLIPPISDTRYPISVYELKGGRRPRDVPEEGLEGIWPEPPFYYLFYRKEPAGEPVLEWLKAHPGFLLTARYELPYEKWQDISLPEISLGSFNIRLSTDMREKPGGIAILIDPGVAFGSGLHPTTQGCLLAISEMLESDRIHTAVDFGAGTGVLAIGCALAGAEFVLAVDCNPLALKNARKNALANGVEDRICFVEADGTGCLGIHPDLFIMNLEWPILEKILAAGEWRKARRVVLAGFLESRLESVKRFAPPSFQVDNVVEREGWPTVTLSAVNSEQ